MRLYLNILTTDVSGLIAARVSRAANAADHVILPEVIFKEPFGPVVRQGGYWQRTWYVILPQALRVAIPPFVNTSIGFSKDTSPVVILVTIGLFDFLTTIKVSLAEPAWTGFGVEAYLFAAFGYFLFCYPMSRYSQGLERNTRPAEGFRWLGRIETRAGGTTIGS